MKSLTKQFIYYKYLSINFVPSRIERPYQFRPSSLKYDTVYKQYYLDISQTPEQYSQWRNIYNFRNMVINFK